MMKYHAHASDSSSDIPGTLRLSMEVAMVIAAFVGFAVILALTASLF